jgi:hypothetical protein
VWDTAIFIRPGDRGLQQADDPVRHRARA